MTLEIFHYTSVIVLDEVDVSIVDVCDNAELRKMYVNLGEEQAYAVERIGMAGEIINDCIKEWSRLREIAELTKKVFKLVQTF